MKNFWYLFSAYAIIWALVGIYVFRLSSKIKELQNRLDDLEME
jgi:CcmD family protein